LYIVPAAQILHALARVGGELHDRRAKSFKFLPAHLVELSLVNDVAALPVIAAIERDKNPAGIEPSHGRHGIFCRSTEPKPENVHRRAEFLHRQTRLLTHDGATAVRADDKISA